VLTAVNLANFTDATGVLAGQLADALHGVGALPTRWRRTPAQQDHLRAVAMALSATDADPALRSGIGV
jgi:ADP-ribosylglycohydrolase